MSLNATLTYILMVIARLSMGQDEQCGGELDTSKYILTNPGYPTPAKRDSGYPSNLDCEWYFIGEGETTAISFKFWDLVIEIGDNGSNESCEYDYVNVSITSVGSRRYCGYKAPPDPIIGVGSLLVHFHSDNSVNYRGFQATYQIVQNYNPCKKNPCKNGDCKRTPNKLRAMCTCHPGYSGIICDKDIDECESDPCLNNGTCNDKSAPNFFTCRCPPKWEGKRCEKEKSPPCLDHPCLNGGTCRQKENFEYSCECLATYSGRNCDIEIGCVNPGIPHIDKNKRFVDQTTLSFSCKDGFQLFGDENITCVNGNWSTTIPQCRNNSTQENTKTLKIWQLIVLGLGVAAGCKMVIFAVWMFYQGPCSNNSSNFPLDNPIERNMIHSVTGTVSEMNDDVFENEEINSTGSKPGYGWTPQPAIKHY